MVQHINTHAISFLAFSILCIFFRSLFCFHSTITGQILRKMKCFSFFKDKHKEERRHRSSPELQTRNSLDNSGVNRGTKSSGSAPSQEKAHTLRVFTFAELRKATNNFDRSLKIGEGGFGSVYKGSILPLEGVHGDRAIVAIKKLKRDGWQGHKEWVAEVKFLGVVEHPNLVKLIGYCHINSKRGIQSLLVYEFMPNKSLEDHLFSRALPSLPWNTRLNILLGAAQGLAYLHNDLEVQVIHRDFKASNVLLDNNFNPKLSDFGLAREGPTDGHTHVSTVVVGTYGYAAPEYVETGHLTTASDVYSFGVVLYEALTGRRWLERNLPESEEKLLDWVKQFPPESKKFNMIMDLRLQNQYSLLAAKRIAKLADSCICKTRDQRPKMSAVVEALRLALQDSQEPPINKEQKASTSSGFKPLDFKKKSIQEVTD